MDKILKILFVGLIVLINSDISCYPWTNNTREHLFGTVTQCADDCAIAGHNHINIAGRIYNVNASIQNEGFRWRNSFTFTVNGQQILPQNWWFQPIVHYDDVAEDFANVVMYRNNHSANLIHSHLSKTVNKVCELQTYVDLFRFPTPPPVNNCRSATVAAITVVIEYNGQLYAFSKLIDINDKPIVTINLTIRQPFNGVDLFSVLDGLSVPNFVNLNCNLPPHGYECTEGKILSQLLDNNFVLLKNEIGKLLSKSKNTISRSINYSHIKLMTLHIGTSMDPCAICTRSLVGLSRYLNAGNNIQSLELGGAGQLDAKFLVEISSNGHYSTSPSFYPGDGMRPDDQQDNFAKWCGNCSHTECAGHDGAEGMPIDIHLGGVAYPPEPMAVPYGSMSNWRLPYVFPYYTVFGRMDANHNVINAPAYNANCGIHNHIHIMRNDLPIIQ
jgi:hypothetical protein